MCYYMQLTSLMTKPREYMRKSLTATRVLSSLIFAFRLILFSCKRLVPFITYFRFFNHILINNDRSSLFWIRLISTLHTSRFSPIRECIGLSHVCKIRWIPAVRRHSCYCYKRKTSVFFKCYFLLKKTYFVGTITHTFILLTFLTFFEIL